MTDKTATHGGSITEGYGRSYPHIDPLTETSVVLEGMNLGSFAGSGMVFMETLGLSNKVDRLTGEIQQLKQLIYFISQKVESSTSYQLQPEDDLELDYRNMESLAQVKIRSGINWKAAPRTKSHSEIFNIQYELEAEEM